eukprot:4959988-Amphidinium_carterae.1
MRFEAAKATLLQIDQDAFLAADRAGFAEVLVLDAEEAAETGQEAEAYQEAPAGGAEQANLKRRKTH